MKLVYIGLPALLMGITVGWYESSDSSLSKGYMILFSFSVAWLAYGWSVTDNKILNEKFNILENEVKELKKKLNKKEKK